MIKFSLLFFCVVAFLVCSCKKEEVETDKVIVPYWKQGNTWKYFITYPDYITYLTHKIVATSNDLITFRYEYDNGHNPIVYYFHEEGFLKRYYDSGYRFSAHNYLKYENANVGDRWEDSSYTYEILSVDEAVTVLAGTFICTKVKAVPHKNSLNPSGFTQPEYGYYSAQYGIIKFDTEYIKYELTRKNF